MTFSNTILKWYYKNARQLPWRETKDPYFIWISEIILQQTRVDQGLPYYQRFTEAFPDVKKLHEASEDQVLKLWQGLGYYSRARNMKKAAQQIVEDFNGEFPGTYQEILSLKGIGPYTAAAISSISFNIPKAVVDGNVYRVLSRHYGIHTPINSNPGKKEFERLAQELIDQKKPGDYNQAIMEFGAVQCLPVNPNCSNCPLNHSCIAYQKSLVNHLPVKEKKLKVQNRYLHYFLIENEDGFLIEKRDDQNIWKGLYQLPLIETKEEVGVENMLDSKTLIELTSGQEFELLSQRDVKHKLTHRNLFIRFYHLKIKDLNQLSFLITPIKSWDHVAYPKPIQSFLGGVFGD